MHTSVNHSIQLVSWASIASLPPKKIVSAPASEMSSSNRVGNAESIQSNRKGAKTNSANEMDAEETEGKRRKKRKKRKAQQNLAVPENPEIEKATVQEPPKIEDDEEFPNLGLSVGETSRFRIQRPFPNSPLFETPSEAWVTHDLMPSLENQFSTARPIETSLKTSRSQSASATMERKKTQEAPKPKIGGKKSKVPVQLDLGGMLAALEKRQLSEKSKPTSKPVVLSVGSAIPVHSKDPVPMVKNNQLKQGKSPHNPLDSSAPLVKKGKQREVPKAKKPSSLKKIILKEREQRKQSRLLEGEGVLSHDNGSLPQDQCDVAEDETNSGNNQDPSLTEAKQDEVDAHPDGMVQCISEVINDATVHNTPATPVNPSLPKIHSRRFREYCNQVLSKEVDSCVTDLLKELVRFQDRLFQKDPVKAKVKRRLVMGLREVLKHLKLKKIKCVIISPNCEKIQSKGGLDETLQTIIACACEQNIPFVFALNRKALGRCVNKAVPVSVVGIFSYDGAQDLFHKICELTMQARQDYKDMISALAMEQLDDEVAEKQNDPVASPEREHSLSDLQPAFLPEENDEPEYIKIWKRMLEKEYDPYSMYLGDNAASEMLNLHL
ncbi:selenocysteine insertion sequence-binding protein 2 [Ambystoma mexicanum]|uniref:selenocysteine insertion sequence-binding protein 2 n=1 Tax=Ambystoma mexicanum TaxID=8296 RepID=UPI0037E79880